MRNLRNLWVDFLRDEQGATMVEYALLLAFIAVVCVGAVKTLGTAISGKFQNAANRMANG